MFDLNAQIQAANEDASVPHVAVSNADGTRPGHSFIIC